MLFFFTKACTCNKFFGLLYALKGAIFCVFSSVAARHRWAVIVVQPSCSVRRPTLWSSSFHWKGKIKRKMRRKLKSFICTAPADWQCGWQSQLCPVRFSKGWLVLASLTRCPYLRSPNIHEDFCASECKKQMNMKKFFLLGPSHSSWPVAACLVFSPCVSISDSPASRLGSSSPAGRERGAHKEFSLGVCRTQNDHSSVI